LNDAAVRTAYLMYLNGSQKLRFHPGGCPESSRRHRHQRLSPIVYLDPATDGFD
jgi:hypothetical protein